MSRASIGISMDQTVSKRPMAKPPRKAPATEPTPPTTAATSAFRPSPKPPAKPDPAILQHDEGAGEPGEPAAEGKRADQEAAPVDAEKRRCPRIVGIGPPGAAEAGTAHQAEDGAAGAKPDRGGEQGHGRDADDEIGRAQERPALGPDRGEPHGRCALRDAQILHQRERQPDGRDKARLAASAADPRHGPVATDGAVDRARKHRAARSEQKPQQGRRLAETQEKRNPDGGRGGAERGKLAESEVEAADEPEDKGVGRGEEAVDRGPR